MRKQIFRWIIFVLPFVAIYRMLRSLQAECDQNRYNPNEHQTINSGDSH